MALLGSLAGAAGAASLKWLTPQQRGRAQTRISCARLVQDAAWHGFAVYHDPPVRVAALKLMAQVLPSPADMRCMRDVGLNDGTARVRLFAVRGRADAATAARLAG